MRVRGGLNQKFATQNPLARIFIGPEGVRAGWRAALFILLFVALIFALAVAVKIALPHHDQKIPARLPPEFILTNEMALLLPALGATSIMGILEDQPFLAYGLGGPRKLRLFLGGGALGLAAISLLTLLLTLTGHATPGSGGLSAAGNLRYAAEWAAASLLIGLTEEFALRGYLLQTLQKGTGFWPAALLTSLLFGALHTQSSGETSIGILEVTLLGIVLCLGIRATQSLYWAIGLHTAWDYGENYLFGTNDSGFPCQGTLLTLTPHGNPTLSGGPTGPEGSLLCTPIIALIALALFWGWRRVR